MERKGFSEVSILVIVGLILVAGVGGYFVWKNSLVRNSQLPISTPQQSSSTSYISQPNSSTSDEVVIPDEYSLFTIASSEAAYAGSYGIEYIDGGVIATGTYAGYDRIIAGIPPNAPGDGGNYSVVFVTKDHKTFIADGDPSKSYADNVSDYSSYLGVEFNSAKVIGFAEIPNDEPPATISLGNFVLVQNDYYWGSMPSSSSQLTSLVPGLTFYSYPSSEELAKQNGYPLNNSTGTQYLYGADDVLVKTPNGPLFDYYLVSQQEFNNSSGTPDTLSGIFYQKSNISSTASLYNLYGEITPSCAGSSPTDEVLQGVSRNDLIQVGTTAEGVVLYTLKNPNHALNQDEYDYKIGEYSSEGESSISEYDPSAPGGDEGYIDAPIPSYSDYVAQNPILIFQDPWGRYIALGEFDYLSPGGCGKPVIYLYPPKPTEVSVKFTRSMRLTTDIPTYAADGWDVLAKPDGELTDLEPQFTPCAAIDSTAPGSEYAASACEQNDYPYLYWEGQASGQYPTPNGGWIVPQAGVADFLDQKLSAIGLTDKEKNDMTSYWVPQLLAKNAPYYRMSFFQTAQMDQFIPMDVTPKPDTVIRVFLDWSPLAAMPAAQLQPEVLNHIDRKGFTLVEWGGLKQ